MNSKNLLLKGMALLCFGGIVAPAINITGVSAQTKRSVAVRQLGVNAPNITATMTDTFPDPNADGRAAPGEEVTYTATITNNGDADATGVDFTNTIDQNSTLVAGSVAVQPDLSTNVTRCTFNTVPALLGNPICTTTSSAYSSTDLDNYTILGGQGNRININASNPSYNNKSQIFSFDATIQSLIQQRMGTIDGVTPDVNGVRLFAHRIQVTAGTGEIFANDQNGYATFTAPNQPFFQFPESGLIYGEITQPNNIEFFVPNTVNSFTIDFMISTKVAAKLVVNEVLANPGGTISDANGEWFELVNTGLFPVNMRDFKIGDSAASGDRPLHLITGNNIVVPGDYFVFGNTTNTTNNGGVPVDYAYGAAISLGNLGPDAIRVVSPVSDSVVLDRVDYPSSSVNSGQNGISRELKDVTLDNSNMESNTNWQFGTVVYGPGGMGTPGAANTVVVVPPFADQEQNDSNNSNFAAPEAGETVTTPLGTIAPGQSIVVTYRVTVANPIQNGAVFLINQGTVSGTNFGSVVTDDQSEAGGADANRTPIGFAPTAAEVTVGGQVTNAAGYGLPRVGVLISDVYGHTRTALTNSFGYYQFDNVQAGETYVISARHKKFEFAAQLVTVNEDNFNVNLLAAE